MFKAYPIKVIHGGRAYSAHYEREGGEILVSSAYGSERAKVGRRKPDKVAEEILAGIVAKWTPPVSPGAAPKQGARAS